MTVEKKSKVFEGSYDRLSGEMEIQIIKEKGKYITRCIETRHPRSYKDYSTDTDINVAMDKYVEILRLASL